MAIMKMRKLRAVVIAQRKDELLRELMHYGCLQLTELSETLSGSAAAELVSPVESEAAELRSRLSEVNRALKLLKSYVPVKKGLKLRKRSLEEHEFLDDTGLRGAMKTAGNILALDLRIRSISSERRRINSTIDALQPWLGLELPLDMRYTDSCGVLIGSLPLSVDFEKLCRELEELHDETELFTIHTEGRERYVLLLCLKEELNNMQRCLRAYGFTVSPVAGQHCTARQCLFDCEAELRELAEEEKSCRAQMLEAAVRRDELKLAADRLSVRLALAEAEGRLCATEKTVLMEGWIPRERERVIVGVLENFGCAYELENPKPEEYPDVPVKLKNNKFTNALNMVTNMYSLPAYGSVDPNPTMAPFFLLFYGLMMADMGYGLIMILAALTAMLIIRPKGGPLSFCQLLLYGGISTFVMGALTGGFFGDALIHIGRLTGKPEGWGVLPCLFSPMDDTIFVMVGSMVLGLLHLNTGMVISFVKKTRRHQLADALWEEGSLWLTMVGIALAVLGIGNYNGIPVTLVVGLLALFYGGTRHKKGWGKLLSIFGTLYNTATGWFGDILSYVRITALMLAGSVIATVFNTIGAIADSLPVFIVVFVIGHTLNFALNLLGCYVHDLRLQCLEYFGKFYEDGGKPFAPLEMKTKYYRVAE